MSHLLRISLLTLLLTSMGSLAMAEESYGKTFGHKLGSSLSNLTLGWLEVPKNMVATSNQVNLAFGVTGGLLKGVLHTLGRTLTGAVDLVTLPLPTQPIVEPDYIWQNFDVETHYNSAFKLKK